MSRNCPRGVQGYRASMTTTTPPPAGDDNSEDPAVDPADAGFPSSPDLDDENVEFTDEDGEVQGSGAG